MIVWSVMRISTSYSVWFSRGIGYYSLAKTRTRRLKRPHTFPVSVCKNIHERSSVCNYKFSAPLNLFYELANRPNYSRSHGIIFPDVLRVQHGRKCSIDELIIRHSRLTFLELGYLLVSAVGFHGRSSFR